MQLSAVMLFMITRNLLTANCGGKFAALGLCPEGLIINSVNFPVQAYIRGTVSGPLSLART
jgi:hypothetical protein